MGFMRAMAAFCRRRQSEAMPALRARRGATGRNRPKADGEAGGPAWPRSGQKGERESMAVGVCAASTDWVVWLGRVVWLWRFSAVQDPV